jgi:hypothetical protein
LIDSSIADPAIAVRREGATWADFSIGVVDPFFMRAAYNSIRHGETSFSKGELEGR